MPKAIEVHPRGRGGAVQAALMSRCRVLAVRLACALRRCWFCVVAMQIVEAFQAGPNWLARCGVYRA
jgi:hypothetical protein